MSELTYQRVVALIPTNSLMMIEDKVGNKLDSAIYILKGMAKIQSSPRKEQISQYLIAYTSPSTTNFDLRFDRTKNQDLKLDLGSIVNDLQTKGAYDLFLRQIAFQLTYQNQPIYVYMENVPPPLGTPLEAGMRRSRIKFLKRHGYDVNKDTVKFRMLRFSVARTRRGILDTFETYTEKFCQLLSRQSQGLIGKLDEKGLHRTVFRGGEYTFYDGIWKDDFMEGEF